MPAGFVIESFTAVSPSRWWLLGTVPCAAKLCPEIAATADAGASFTTMPAPGGAYRTSQATPPVSSIRFADPADGWVFGPKLYATHDGGRHWTAVDLPGHVTALEPGLDRVFATVDPRTPPCYSTGTCDESTPGAQVWRSTPGSNRWAVDAAAGYASAGLAVHGMSVWVMNSIATKDGPAIGTRLLYSADGGDHFVTQPQPVTGVACDYQPVSNQVLWAYCSGGHFMFVYRSTDSGAHFTETQDSQTPNANNCPNGSQLAAATETTAVAACNLGREATAADHERRGHVDGDAAGSKPERLLGADRFHHRERRLHAVENRLRAEFRGAAVADDRRGAELATGQDGFLVRRCT